MSAVKRDKALTSKPAAWVRPRLVVLARGTPEESVLAGCKTFAPGMSGPSSINAVCEKMIVPRCMKCNKQGTT